jgi:hypothetical protein
MHIVRPTLRPFPNVVRSAESFIELQARYKTAELIGVRADVANATARTCSRRIRAPGRLLLPGFFQIGGEPVLRIFTLHHANVAELPAATMACAWRIIG